jgi:hypothetical protein
VVGINIGERDGVVAVLPARHRNVPEWSLEETTARKDGR